MPRFKTQFRGCEIDVEMELVQGPEPSFTLIFHDAKRPIKPTREELAFLCREAARAERKARSN